MRLGIILIVAILTWQTLSPNGMRSGRVATAKPQPREIHCLATNIYHEARGEPVEGQIAVAQVTVNRLRHPSFAATLCGVVHEYKQFSWTLEKRKKIRDDAAWTGAIAIATLVLSHPDDYSNFKALYYHTRQVRPYWSKNKRIAAVIGNHIFYY